MPNEVGRRTQFDGYGQALWLHVCCVLHFVCVLEVSASENGTCPLRGHVVTENAALFSKRLSFRNM